MRKFNVTYVFLIVAYAKRAGPIAMEIPTFFLYDPGSVPVDVGLAYV